MIEKLKDKLIAEINREKNRLVIFIDGSNFYHGLKAETRNTRINFKKFSEKLSEGYNLIKVRYYNSPSIQQNDPVGYKKQQRFFNYIRSLPRFELIKGRLEKRKMKIPDNIYEKIKEDYPDKSMTYYEEKGVDICIAVDIVSLAYMNYYDTAILVSGDGDFVPAIKGAQDKGKKIITAYFKSSEWYHLKRSSDKIIIMDDEYINSCR